MAHEPDMALLMTASGSLDIFLKTIVTKIFCVIFHLPDYQAISNTRITLNGGPAGHVSN